MYPYLQEDPGNRIILVETNLPTPYLAGSMLLGIWSRVITELMIILASDAWSIDSTTWLMGVAVLTVRYLLLP